jgi:hypothetical protein
MPDHHDAALIVQLAQWGEVMGLDEASAVLFDDDFDPETASVQDAPVRKILRWGETIGTLTKNGLLDQDLVLDWLWAQGLWERVGPAAREQRERLNVPELYENFEALASAQAGP